MGRIFKKKTSGKTKNLNLKFVIDCQQPVDDKVLVTNDFNDFLKQKIKVHGKVGNFGNDISVSSEPSKIILKSDVPFSKRYLKYLTKKYLKKNQLRDYLHVVAIDKNTYQLRYFDIQEEADEE